jgi:hypothetical protein
MACGEGRDQGCIEQLSDAAARNGGVVGDEDELAFLLSHQLFQQAFRRAHAHKAADHDRRAVRNHRYGFFC